MGALVTIVQQELYPSILGAVGEASPRATANTGPKHKPRCPKGRLTGSQTRLPWGLQENIANITAGGLILPQPRGGANPCGVEALGAPPAGGAINSAKQPPFLILSLVAAGHSVPLSPLGEAQWSSGISAGGESLPGKGRDGDAGGGSGCGNTRAGAGDGSVREAQCRGS